MGRRRRSAEEIKQVLEGYRTSGMTRDEYCRQVGIAISTLGRYLRRRGNSQRLVKVSLETTPEHDGGFVLVLGNGRRIESGWKFGETELALLIRVAEAV